MKFVDLFCGAGGLTRGLIDSGHKCVLSADIWRNALDVHSLNIPQGTTVEADLTDINAASAMVLKKNPDFICGGPPCQDFSTAGNMEETENASMTQVFAEICVVSAKVSVMENVPAARRFDSYKEALRIFESSGWGHSEHILHASDYGVPQRRRRLFLFAWEGGPRPGMSSSLESYFETRAQPEVTVREALGDIKFSNFFMLPRNYGCRGVFSVDEPSPTLRTINPPVPTNYKDHPSDTAPSATVNPLTVQQRSVIQGFPEEWEWRNSKGEAQKNSDINKMIGNSVPPPLGEIVGQALKDIVLPVVIDGEHVSEVSAKAGIAHQMSFLA